MASLTLKNLPDEFLQMLRDAAERDRRSLTQEIIHLLETALRAPPKIARPDTDAQVARWRKLAGKWKSGTDGATEAKRIIEKRTRGREVDL